MKRLSTGNVTSEGTSEANDKIIRTAILVHSGENGEKITFLSADGEISFDDARIKNIVKSQNKLTNELAAGYGGIDKMPIGAFPPILDAHEDDSNDRVRGRLASILKYEKRDVPGVGKNVSCLIGDITFLGKDVVEKVNDGRIYHLSIGIDEMSDTISEVSTVIKPAANGAMLLKKGEKNMNKNAKLMALKSAVTKMSSKISDTNKMAKLTKRQGEVTHKLSGLMKGGRLTPAEYKKLDIKKLSALDNVSFETIMSTFEAREPQVLVGQRGTTDAQVFSDIAKGMKKSQIKNLKSEVMKDMKKLSGKKLEFKNDEVEEDKDHGQSHEMAAEEKPVKEVEGGEFHEKMKALGAHLEAGDLDKAKEAHEMCMKHMEEKPEDIKHMGLGDVKSEDYQKSTEELQKQIDELNTQVGRISGMIDELIKVEHEEGEEMVEEGKEHEKLPQEKTMNAEEAAKKLEEETKHLDEQAKNEDDKKLSEEEKKKLGQQKKA